MDEAQASNHDHPAATAGSATIDDLPEGVLLHILTFLPLYDAIRTSAISPKWRYLWHSIPSLSLDLRYFPHLHRSLSKTHLLFCNFIDQTLLLKQSQSSLRKFRVGFFGSRRNHQSLITSWIRYGIRSQIAELELDFYGHFFYEREMRRVDNYLFDFFYLMNGSVEILKLRYCRIALPSPNCRIVSFLSLQSIFLEGVHLTDGMMSNMMSLCQNLEKLSFERFWGVKILQISHPKLRELKLWYFHPEQGDGLDSSIEICAPSLQLISFVDFHVSNYCFKEMSSLAEAKVDFPGMAKEDYECWKNVVNQLSGVERLSIQNQWLPFLGLKSLSSDRYTLGNLNHLELKTGYTEEDLLGLAALLHHCPHLKTMVLIHVHDPNEAGNVFKEYNWTKPLSLHIPYLRHVTMRNFKGKMTEFYVFMLLKRHRVVLEKIVVIPAKEGERSLDPFVVDYLTAGD